MISVASTKRCPRTKSKDIYKGHRTKFILIDSFPSVSGSGGVITRELARDDNELVDETAVNLP